MRGIAGDVGWRAPTRSHRGWGRVLLLVGLAVVLVAAAFIQRTASRLGDPSPRSASVSVEHAKPADAAVSSLRRLPAPTRLRAGLPAGFPHDRWGAAALAVEVTGAQIGFDYAQAREVATTYSDQESRAAMSELVATSVATRRTDLGVPENGPVPAPATFALSPYAVRLHEIGPGRFAVSVLSLASTTDRAGRLSVSQYVGTSLLSWGEAPGDWSLVQPTSSDRAAVAAAPAPQTAGQGDLERLVANGWTPIRCPLTDSEGGG